MLRGLRSIGQLLLRAPRAVRIGAPVAWMAGIWGLSSSSFGGGEPNLWWSWISNLAHAPLFGGLAVLFVAALFGGRESPAWPRVEGWTGGLVLLLVGFYGMIDEAHQSLTPGRDPALTDIGTDVLGATCVLWIIAYLGRADADRAGLHGRLAVGVLACAAATLAFSLP